MKLNKTISLNIKKDPWLWALFSVYILFLFWIVIFKTRFMILVRPERELCLIPFKFAIETGSASQIFDIIANILVFIPFGLYQKMLGLRSCTTVLCAASLSLFFELSQFIFKIGVTDITDLLTNTSGAFLGVLICSLIYRCFAHTEKLEKTLKLAATVCSSAALVWFFAALCRHISL